MRACRDPHLTWAQFLCCSCRGCPSTVQQSSPRRGCLGEPWKHLRCPRSRGPVSTGRVRELSRGRSREKQGKLRHRKDEGPLQMEPRELTGADGLPKPPSLPTWSHACPALQSSGLLDWVASSGFIFPSPGVWTGNPSKAPLKTLGRGRTSLIISVMKAGRNFLIPTGPLRPGNEPAPPIPGTGSGTPFPSMSAPQTPRQL